MAVNYGDKQALHTLTLYRLFMRKIPFTKRRDQTNQLYKDLKILKFSDLVHLQNFLFMEQSGQKENLAKFFVSLNMEISPWSNVWWR